MREWRVRKPAAGPAEIDWTLPEPAPKPRPDHVQTPWGEVFRPCVDGYWRTQPYDPPLSYAALLDKIDRFELRWHTLRPGVSYRVVPLGAELGGERLAVLWRNGDGSYRAGHVALRGERDGVWLAQREPFRRAAGRIELWWLGHGVTRRGHASAALVAARLRTSPVVAPPADRVPGGAQDGQDHADDQQDDADRPQETDVQHEPQDQQDQAQNYHDQ